MRHRESRFIVKLTVGVIAITGIIAYGVFQARSLITGPIITIKSPQNGETLAQSSVTIEGVATNIVSLSLNNQPILVTPAGVFKEQLLLSEGYNIITVTAEDRFKRTVEKRLELIFHDHGV